MDDTAVYIGAGMDVKPLLLFRHIRTFIYVDSQPLTEFGSIEPRPGHARPRFPIKFYQLMNKLGFIKTYTEANNLHIYVNPKTCTCLKYYMSERFPEYLSEEATQEISKANILICCGHNPHEKILDLMKPGPKVFIGDNTSYYYASKYDPSVIDKLIKEPTLMKEYLRFDIPTGYPWWQENYIETHHVARFNVTVYSTLEELTQNMKRND